MLRAGHARIQPLFLRCTSRCLCIRSHPIAAAMATSATPHATPGAVLTSIDTSTYDAQLAAKKESIETQFAEFHPPSLEVFRSSPEHYRMR